MCLAAFGLFILYSASGKDIDRVARQLIFLAIAFFGLVVVAQFKVEILKVLAPIGYIGGIVLLTGISLCFLVKYRLIGQSIVPSVDQLVIHSVGRWVCRLVG